MPFGCCLPGSSRAALDRADDRLPPVRKLVVDRGRVITAPATPKRTSVRIPRWPISRYSSAYKDRRVLKTTEGPLEAMEEKSEASFLTFKALDIDTDSTPSLDDLSSPVSPDYEIPSTPTKTQLQTQLQIQPNRTTKTKPVPISHSRRVSRMAIHDQYWSQPDGDLFGQPYGHGIDVKKIRLQPCLREQKASPSPRTSTDRSLPTEPITIPRTRRSHEVHNAASYTVSSPPTLLPTATLRKRPSGDGPPRASSSDPLRSPSRSSHRGSSAERRTLVTNPSTTTPVTSTPTTTMSSTKTTASTTRVRAASSSRTEVGSSALHVDALALHREPVLCYSRSLTAVHVRTPSESLAPPPALQQPQQPRKYGPPPPPKGLSRVIQRTPSVALQSQVSVAVAIGVGRRESGREVGIVPVGRRKISGEERRMSISGEKRSSALADRSMSDGGEKRASATEGRPTGDRRSSVKRRSMRMSAEGEKVVGMRERGRTPAATAVCDKALPPSPKLLPVGLCQ